MKSLIHTVYRSGSAGLSNLIMSIELGVVLSSLTDRALVLKGNSTPVANVVQYDGIVRNTHPSRITDLIDLGVPWVDADEINLAAFAPHELCNEPAWDCVFHFPGDLSIESDDFRSFARGRTTFITVGEELEHVPALAFSGGAEEQTLSFYSYFFYLDHAAQLKAFDALRRVQPKPELKGLAARAARDLGQFNAVHIRRGDFKVTTGVTTRDRTAEEAIEMLDGQFGRDERLVILTDEASDPFFDEIKAAYRDHVFLDHHILENYEKEFSDLPARDSIALAYLSQLVAADSQNFVGSMSSTFTSLIQRSRGNAGKEEPFKFLWNELPAPGDKLEPGRHAKSDCIRLENGVMVEDWKGPYSWNRMDERLNPGWMREWPESFLNNSDFLDQVGGRINAGNQISEPAGEAGTAQEIEPDSRLVTFLDVAVSVGSNRDNIARDMSRLFEQMIMPGDGSSLAEVRIEEVAGGAKLLVDGRKVHSDRPGPRLLRSFYREVVRRFIDRYPELIWLHAGCAASDAGALVMPGAWGHGKSSLVLELYKRGWLYLSDDITPVNAVDGMAMPFPGTPQIRRRSDKELPRERLGSLPKSAVLLDPLRVADQPQPLSMIVFPRYAKGEATTLTPVSPANAAGALLENCVSFTKNEDAAIGHMCALMEGLPAYSLNFGDAAEAAELLISTQASAAVDVHSGGSDDKEDKVAMGTGEGVRSVEVEVTLSQGQRHTSVLPSDSPILHDLFAALAIGQGGSTEQPATLVQLPMNGGRAACSFMSSSLVSVTTKPPVLIELQPSGGMQRIGPELQDHVHIDEFLTPDENRQLLEFALASEAEFTGSTVTTDVEGYRKSRVLHTVDKSKWCDIFMSRLKVHVPHLAASLLNVPEYEVGRHEIQLTASNDGDFFKAHADSGDAGDPTEGRELTFVYYLHRTPRPYTGGDLLLYQGDPGRASDDNRSAVTSITPRNNCLIAFASNRWHEVDVVRCPSGAFADSRFTVNGWLRRDAE